VAQEGVHERRLAVVELAEDDEVEALVFDLGDARGADVAGQRRHADRLRDVGELPQPGEDLALGQLVSLEEDHGRGL
jgi:hypothetical protein